MGPLGRDLRLLDPPTAAGLGRTEPKCNYAGQGCESSVVIAEEEDSSYITSLTTGNL